MQWHIYKLIFPEAMEWKPEKEPTRAYRICVSIHRSDPCPRFRMSFFFFFLGRGIKFRYCSCSRPWALCNQLAHCTGAVEVVMGPQIRPLESSYILVKKMHAGLGLNTESFKCLLCRTAFGELFPQLPSLPSADSLILHNGDSLRLPLLIKTRFFII